MDVGGVGCRRRAVDRCGFDSRQTADLIKNWNRRADSHIKLMITWQNVKPF